MKTIDLIDRKCPLCAGNNTTWALEDREIPYGEPGPKAVVLRCHAIVQSCPDCKQQFLNWQNEAIADVAVEVYCEKALVAGLETEAK